MKVRPDKIILGKDYLKNRAQNILRKTAIIIAFISIYFFFIKLLFL